MNQKQRMLAELPYLAWKDGLAEERMQAKLRMREYNLSSPQDPALREKLLRGILGRAGEMVYMEPPFYFDYGTNIEVGDRFYANFNCTILDVARVVIGHNVMFAPNVSLYTAGHPIHPETRNTGYEYGIGIVIGNNVWIGGNTVVNPGVQIGDNAVIGAGSVVTRSIPANVVAAGNPCRVIREITEADRNFYFKDRVFDVVV